MQLAAVDTIKGIKNFYIFRFNDKNFFLLGDVHEKGKDSCPQNEPCDRMTPNLKNLIINMKASCITSTALFYEWFMYNNKNNIYTDFYIESPIPKQGNAVSTQIATAKKEHESYQVNDGGSSYDKRGFMFDTLIMLESCLLLDRKDCPFNPNVRIHYTDPRTAIINGEQQSATPFILDDIYNLFRGGGLTLNDTYKSGGDYVKIMSIISDRLKDFLKIIYYLITHAEELLNICMQYADFTVAINAFIAKIPGNTLVMRKLTTHFDTMKLFVKKRGDIPIHYIAAQLYALRMNGKGDIADKIESYCRETTRNFAEKLYYQAIDPITQQYNLYSLQFLELEIRAWISAVESFINGKSTYDGLTLINNFHEKVLPALSEIINNKIIVLSGVYIECYTLARMFRYDDSMDVIINAGSTHNENYAKFFTNYLELMPVISVDNTSDANLCVKLPDLNNYINIDAFRRNLSSI